MQYQYLIAEHMTNYYIKAIRRIEHRSGVLENVVLRRIFVPKDNVT
jgi:hypothetical protein